MEAVRSHSVRTFGKTYAHLETEWLPSLPLLAQTLPVCLFGWFDFVPNLNIGRPVKYERFIRPMGLRYKKANVTHPELGVTVQLPIISVKKVCYINWKLYDIRLTSSAEPSEPHVYAIGRPHQRNNHWSQRCVIHYVCRNHVLTLHSEWTWFGDRWRKGCVGKMGANFQ